MLPTLGVTPYAALQAQDFHTPSYSETDVTGGGFGLSYAAMSATDIRSELGARFDDPTVIGGLPLLLRARVAWAHDFVSNPALSAVFESLPATNFVVNGAPIPQNSALTSAGAELYITLAPHLARQVRRRVRPRLADLRRQRHGAVYVVTLDCRRAWYDSPIFEVSQE